jgi:superfamily II DNA/RNA helicase
MLPLLERLVQQQEATASSSSPSSSAAVVESGGGGGGGGDTEAYPRALVLAPNRELVQQILVMTAPVLDGLPLRLGAARGGANEASWPYIVGRSDAPDVLVCTPQFAARHSKNLDLFASLESVVLDEADMLLDGGFLNQIDQVLVARKRVARLALAAAAAAAAAAPSATGSAIEGATVAAGTVGDAPRSSSTSSIGGGAAGGNMKATGNNRARRSEAEAAALAAHSCQVVLSAATLPNYGTKSVDELVRRMFPGAVRVENRLLHHTQPLLRQDWVELPPASGPAGMSSAEGGRTPSDIMALQQLADFMAAEVSAHFDAQTTTPITGSSSSSSSSASNSATAAAAAPSLVSFPRTMVFANTVKRAHAALDVLTAALVEGGDRGLLPPGAVRGYHKEVKPDEREETLRSFATDYGGGGASFDAAGASSSAAAAAEEAPCRVLVCTDLAARGLDIMDVDHIVQFDFASNVVQHLHRLGRTARAGKPGRATHFHDAGSELAAMIRAATEGGEPLDESFSRKRGFRKKIKKTGRAFNAKAQRNAGKMEKRRTDFER